jgi:hypothetical protein
MQPSESDSRIQEWLSDLRDGTQPERLHARRSLAVEFERRGMLEEAIDLLIANIREGQRDAQIFRRLSSLYRQQGDEVRAMQAAAEAAKYLPSADPVVETLSASDTRVASPQRPLVATSTGRRLLSHLGGCVMSLGIFVVATIIILIVGGLVLGMLAGPGAGAKTSADQGVVLRSRPGQNPLKDGPFQFSGGTYRVEWSARDVTPLGACGNFIRVEPSGRTGSLGGVTPAVRGEVPAGSSSSGSGTKYLTAGSYDVTVMSGCGEWTVTVRRE